MNNNDLNQDSTSKPRWNVYESNKEVQDLWKKIHATSADETYVNAAARWKEVHKMIDKIEKKYTNNGQPVPQNVVKACDNLRAQCNKTEASYKPGPFGRLIRSIFKSPSKEKLDNTIKNMMFVSGYAVGGFGLALGITLGALPLIIAGAVGGAVFVGTIAREVVLDRYPPKLLNSEAILANLQTIDNDINKSARTQEQNLTQGLRHDNTNRNLHENVMQPSRNMTTSFNQGTNNKANPSNEATANKPMSNAELMARIEDRISVISGMSSNPLPSDRYIIANARNDLQTLSERQSLTKDQKSFIENARGLINAMAPPEEKNTNAESTRLRRR